MWNLQSLFYELLYLCQLITQDKPIIDLDTLLMKKCPLPVLIVSILFIVAGGVGFIYHFKEFFEANATLYELLWVEFVRILAIVCGLLLLMSVNWARWLAIAWLIYHIMISALNSTSEMMAHIVFLLVIVVLLYLPKSSEFFHKKKQN